MAEYIERDECRDKFYEDDLPAADVQPVKHGEWIEISSIRKIGKCNIPISKCSCCGFSFCDILNSNELYKLCPSCGSVMRDD
ncbi:MAG: hypothetical protein ACI4JN_12595 [Ruminococcus sp.]